MMRLQVVCRFNLVMKMRCKGCYHVRAPEGFCLEVRYGLVSKLRLTAAG
jgi:hypothetical protein